MANVPYNPFPTAEPEGVPARAVDYQRIDARPEAFGELGARGLLKGAEQLESASDKVFRAGLAFAGMQNETMAKEADIALSQHLSDLQYNPQTGYYNKQGKDAVDSYQDTYNQTLQAYRTARAALPNRQAQQMFDQVAVRRVQYAQEQMANHAATQNKQWIVGTGEARIANEINTRSLAWNDDNSIREGLGTIAAEARDRAAVLGFGPDSEKSKQEITHYQSEFMGSVVRQAMAAETAGQARPGTAEGIFAKYRSAFDAAHAGALDQQIESRKYTLQMRDIMNTQKQIAMEERNLRINQASVFGKLYADKLQGKEPSVDERANLVRTRQITPEMDKFLSAEGGQKDDVPTAIDLGARARNGDMTAVDDAVTAANNGLLKGTTAAKIAATAASRSVRGQDQLERADFAQLRTFMGLNSNEQPMFDLGKEANAEQVGLWSRAQQEWNERVLMKGEKSHDVLVDMQAEYARPTMPTLPTPRFGSITSLEDFKAVGEKTQQAGQDGTLTESEYEHQAHLLILYHNYLLSEQQKAQAKANVPLKGNTGGAKLRGVQPQENP